MKKFYYIDWLPIENKISAIYYFEVPEKHWNSLDSEDYIQQYENEQTLLFIQKNPAGGGLPSKQGLNKNQLEDYDYHDLIPEIFDDKEYFVKHKKYGEEPPYSPGYY